MKPMAIDFETYYDDEYSLSTLGIDRYCEDDRFDPYLVAIVSEDYVYAGPVEDADWSKTQGHLLVAHNARFDRKVYQRLCGIGRAPGADPNAPWTCSADLSVYVQGGRSLKDASYALLGDRVSKEIRTKAKGKDWPALLREGMGEAMIEYCCNDARRSLRIWEKYNSEWPEIEQGIARDNRDTGSAGIRLNVPLLDDYIERIRRLVFEAEKKIPWSDEEDSKILSRKRLAQECRSEGIPVPTSLAKDSPECAAWEDEFSDRYPWVEGIRAWRRGNTMLKRLMLLKNRCRTSDDSFPFGLKYFGAHCVIGEHEVLTRDGWVPLKDWGDSEIAQWSEQGGVEFLPATANRFRCREDLVEIDAPFVKAVMTEGHTLPTYGTDSGRFSPRQAGWAFGHSQLAVPVTGRFEHGDSPEGRVLAMVQADGHWLPEIDGGGLQLFFHKARKKKRCRKLLQAASIPFRELAFTSHPKGLRFYVRKGDCPSWLTRERKVFGAWCYALPREWQSTLLHECRYWDGWVGPVSAEYYSSILANAEVIHTLAHIFGTKARIYPKEKGFSVYLSGRTSGRAWVKRKHWKTVSKKPRFVFCPSTQTGYWLTRYKGVVSVTGNTGRFSGSDGFNMQNMYREDRADEFAGVNMRALFVPRKGKKFLVYDYSQIEPRCLYWIVGDARMLDQIGKDSSVYEAHARLTLGYSGSGRLKDTDSSLYKLAKARVLGGGYGAGGARFQSIAKIMAGLDLSVAESIAAVKRYRQDNPKVVNLWRTLQNYAQWSVGSDLELELPSWRSLRYYDVMRREGGLAGRTQLSGAHKKMFGGKLTENLIQAIARDVFVEGLLRVKKLGAPALFHTHDELAMEVPEDISESDVKDIEHELCREIEWMPGLPLEVEGGLMEAYGEEK